MLVILLIQPNNVGSQLGFHQRTPSETALRNIKHLKCDFLKQKLSLTTKTPFKAASGKNQDNSMHNFVVKNRALQPMSRLTATSMYPH